MKIELIVSSGIRNFDLGHDICLEIRGEGMPLMYERQVRTVMEPV